MPTVAYLPQSIQGHAVLAAIACQQIIMAPDATIGAAGIDEKTILPEMADRYKDIANRRRTVPEGIAVALLNPAEELYTVDTEDAKGVYVDRAGLEKLKSQKAVGTPKVVKPAGEQAQFTGSEARKMAGFVSYLATTAANWPRLSNLPPSAIEEDPSLDRGWKAVRVDVKGPLLGDVAVRVQKMIEDQIQLEGANFICLWIDSPGGSPEDCVQLGGFLAALDPSKVRTVAYFPSRPAPTPPSSRWRAIRWSCYPQATLGGVGGVPSSRPKTQPISKSRSATRSPRKKAAPWSLMAAMIDPRLEVYRCTRLGETAVFLRGGTGRAARPEAVDQGGENHHARPAAAALRHEGRRARLVNHVVESFAEFQQIYGLENDPALVEPGWADVLIDGAGIARRGHVAAGHRRCGGLYIELHSPGIGRRRRSWPRFASCCSSGAATWAAPPAGSKSSLFVAGVGACCWKFS